MPARDAARTLAQQLDAIAEQDYAGPWELIVAVNGGRDGTAEVAARLDRSSRARPTGGRLGPPRPRPRPQPWRGRRGRRLPRVLRRRRRRLAGVAARPGRGRRERGHRDRAPLAGAAQCAAGALLPERVAARQAFPRLPANRQPARTAACGGRSSTRSAGSTSAGFRARTCRFSWRAQLRGFRFGVADEALVHKRFRPSRVAMARQYFRYGIGDVWLYSRYRSAGMPRRDRRAVCASGGPSRRACPRTPARRAAGAGCCRGPRSRAGGSPGACATGRCSSSRWARDI